MALQVAHLVPSDLYHLPLLKVSDKLCIVPGLVMCVVHQATAADSSLDNLLIPGEGEGQFPMEGQGHHRWVVAAEVVEMVAEGAESVELEVHKLCTVAGQEPAGLFHRNSHPRAGSCRTDLAVV